MEGFLEANRIVEISLSKLATGTVKNSGDLPLRRTLLVSRVLNTAQDMATSVQNSLLLNSQTSSSKCSSKLLANFGQNQSNTDGLPANLLRTPKPLSRQQSPIAIPGPCHENLLNTLQPDEESMDFENLLGDILHEVDSDGHALVSQGQEQDHDNTSDSWPDSDCLEVITRPVSPGKRNHQQAFLFATEAFEDLKRFKSCTPEASSLQCVPGFCGYLSSKNLQTAPFITYMFGRGFTYPSNPDLASYDWPTARTDHNDITDQELIAISNNNSTFTPILAF